MPRLFGFAPVPIPGPKSFPLLGTAKALYELLDDPIGVVLRLRARGDVVALIDRNPAVVCVFGTERNREVLSNPAAFQHDETLFRGRPGSAMDKMRFSTVTINGDLHRRHRKLMMPAFQRAALDTYADQIVEVTRHMLGRFRIGAVNELATLCQDLALTMAMRCLYGLDVSAEATELGNLAAEWVKLVTDPATILLPFDLPGFRYRKVQEYGERVCARLQALLERKRAIGGPQKDAMALLLAARDDDGEPLSDDEIVAEAASLFVAGHETTAMALTWTLFLLEQHPTIQAELRAELAAVLGERDPTPDDLPQLVVLDRVIKESLRVLPPVPMLFLRVCAGTATVGGYDLPPGANLLLSPLGTHQDPTLYPQPRRFLPQRWIGKSPTPYGYLPFGAGPRTCLGMLFAERALRLMLPMMLQRFRFSIPAGTRIDRLTRGNILRPRHGLPMLLEPASAPPRPPTRPDGDIHDLLITEV